MGVSRSTFALCERSGFAENFDALNGAGLRDTWTASSYLLRRPSSPAARVVICDGKIIVNHTAARLNTPTTLSLSVSISAVFPAAPCLSLHQQYLARNINGYR
jgi:hypothetical protein